MGVSGMYQYMLSAGVRAASARRIQEQYPFAVLSVLDASSSIHERDLAGRLGGRLQALITTGSAAVDEAVVTTYVTGGKWIRPRLVVDFARCAGAELNAEVLEIAASIELLHIATLIHDDVIDRADTRRGKPALHTVVGEQRAIVVADVLLGISASSSTTVGAHFSSVWSDALLGVSRGQNREFDLRYNIDVSMDEMLAYAAQKTGVLISAACRAGALLGRWRSGDVQGAADFGMSLGVAFQLADDLVDLCAEPEAVDKPVRQDIANGIYTSAVIFGRDDSAAEASATLREALSAGDALKATDLLRRLGAFRSAAHQARSFALEAESALEHLAPRALAEFPVRYIERQLDRAGLGSSVSWPSSIP